LKDYFFISFTQATRYKIEQVTTVEIIFMILSNLINTKGRAAMDLVAQTNVFFLNRLIKVTEFLFIRFEWRDYSIYVTDIETAVVLVAARLRVLVSIPN